METGKQLVPLPTSNAEMVERLASSAGLMQINVDQMSTIVAELANVALMLDKRLHTMEAMMEKRISVSSTQARRIANAVRERARTLCEQNSLPYPTGGKMIRESIWRALRAEYQIQSHYDLPEAYYSHALAFVEGWTSFAVIRRVRRKCDEHSGG